MSVMYLHHIILVWELIYPVKNTDEAQEIRRWTNVTLWQIKKFKRELLAFVQVSSNITQ